MKTIDASAYDFRTLNEAVRAAVAAGERRIRLDNVNGQRYIGCGLRGDALIEVRGVPGADMAAFMDGPEIRVRGNAESAVCNTMNAGRVLVHGSVGDVAGYAMRGGCLYVRGDAGYRVGIHMKSFRDKVPAIVVGGTAQDFLGEYMAGGFLVVLGLDAPEGKPLAGRFVGAGLHGGAIFLRGEIEERHLGAEISPSTPDSEDEKALRRILKDYCREFVLPLDEVMSKPFVKLAAHSHRPYARLYAY